VPRQGGDQLAVGDRPELERLVEAAGDNAGTVRREDNRVDLIHMALEMVGNRLPLHIPDDGGVILAA
jgi:hypothetical protein